MKKLTKIILSLIAFTYILFYFSTELYYKKDNKNKNYFHNNNKIKEQKRLLSLSS